MALLVRAKSPSIKNGAHPDYHLLVKASESEAERYLFGQFCFLFISLEGFLF